MERDKLKKDTVKRPEGVFYLESNRGFFYDQTLSAPIALDFPQDIISDLEVVSKKKLETAIQVFITSSNIVPKSIIILFSPSITFDKDFALGTVQMDKNIQEFLDLVPFQEYISRQSKFQKKIKLVAANKELSDVLKEAFENIDFSVSAIIPLSFCLEVLPQLQSNLDLGLILDKATELKGYSLTTEVMLSDVSQKKEKKDNKKLFIMLGVLGLLFIILLIVIYKFVLTSPKPKTLPVNSVVPPVPTVFEEPLPTTAQKLNSSSDFSTESANIQNLNEAI